MKKQDRKAVYVLVLLAVAWIKIWFKCKFFPGFLSTKDIYYNCVEETDTLLAILKRWVE